MAPNIKIMEKWGYGLSKKEIIFAMEQYLKMNSIKTPFKDNIPGKDYFINFTRRHDLSHKKPQSVEVPRKRAVDPFVISHYFELLSNFTHNVPPERIYNIDETSFCLDPSRIKVVGEKGKAAHRVTAGPGRENFTVLIMGGSASGRKLPPLIIFRGKHIWDSWMAKGNEEFPDMTYAATENGWMNSETFSNYFQHSFLPAIGKHRPVILIYDGHSSHVSLEIIEIALNENVIILKLPPHTSHLLQPMDLAVFKPLKQEYDNAVIKWQRKHYGIKMPKQEFSAIISRIWMNVDSQVIKSGFKKAGIHPFNNDVIPVTIYEPAALERFKKSKEITSMTPESKTQCRTLSQTVVETVPGVCNQHAIPKQSTSADNSFETMLLDYVKQETNHNTSRRRRVCTGAEVITSLQAVKKLQNIKDEKRTAKKKNRS